jgi:hypothetical protein
LSFAAQRAARGEVRASGPSIPPHVCPRQGRRNPTPTFFAAGEVIYFALVAVYGQNICPVGRVAGRAEDNARHRPKHAAKACPWQGRRRTLPRFCAVGEVTDFALVAVYSPNNGFVYPR